jgi:glucose-1-phosphate adenylyltransferase
MCAYEFEGYWRDIGTVESFWEANMDLLPEYKSLDLNDDLWEVYTQSNNAPATIISKDAKIKNSIISNGCNIKGEVYNSLVAEGTHIEKGTYINNSVIMPHCRVENSACVQNSILSQNVWIKQGAIVGFELQNINDRDSRNITAISDNLIIRPFREPEFYQVPFSALSDAAGGAKAKPAGLG